MPGPCCDPTDTFWSDQLAATKALFAAYNAALLAFATSNVQSYELDTGQTRQTVKRAMLGQLKATRDALLNEVAVLEQRLYGCSTIRVVPGF